MVAPGSSRERVGNRGRAITGSLIEYAISPHDFLEALFASQRIAET